jgi:hypothetical protein
MAPLTEDDDCTRRFRNLTLKSCMLVSQSFAYEFRPYLYETLYIVDTQSLKQQYLACDRLSSHARVLQDRTEYQCLVKKLIITLDASSYLHLRQSLINASEFPSWLAGLSSVSSIVFGSLSKSEYPPSLSEILGPAIRPITRLCSRLSVRCLTFIGFNTLPQALVNTVPNPKYLVFNCDNVTSIDHCLRSTVSRFCVDSPPSPISNIRIKTYINCGWAWDREWERRKWLRLDEALCRVSNLKKLQLVLYRDDNQGDQDSQADTASLLLPALSSKAGVVIEEEYHWSLCPLSRRIYPIYTKDVLDLVL